MNANSKIAVGCDLSRAEHQLRVRLYQLGTRFLPNQERMIRAYINTGRLSAVGGRGSGKSYTLAYLCAVELTAGSSVVFRSGISDSYCAARSFRKNLSLFLTSDEMDNAQASVRLWLPLSKIDYIGRKVHVDFRDEVWTGAYFHRVYADRVAQVGSFPEHTIILPEAEEPQPVRTFRDHLDGASPPVTEEADQCFRVGSE